MNQFFISLGSNIGARSENLTQAQKLIRRDVGEIISASSVYETEPWGLADQDAFFNQVILVKSEWGAHVVLNKVLAIEREMGRVRDVKWGPRLIDIDILLFNDEEVHTSDLNIPHPEMHNRRFVLEPLAEIAPDKMHPVLQRKINDLRNEMDDLLHVRKR